MVRLQMEKVQILTAITNVLNKHFWSAHKWRFSCLEHGYGANTLTVKNNLSVGIKCLMYDRILWHNLSQLCTEVQSLKYGHQSEMA
jgi:hypothetical protein